MPNPEVVRDAMMKVRSELGRIIMGQEPALEQLATCLLAGGHVILEGVPGLGKTLLAKSLAKLVDAQFRRIQFTPDLLPSDIVGTNIFNVQTSEFSLYRGPIFTEILLADEINRTPPKTQAALLEAMEEKQVTLDGVKNLLPELFFVIATQNPVEYEGTYPLPETQLDRFMMKIVLGYPSQEAELSVIRHYADGVDLQDLDRLIPSRATAKEEILAFRREVSESSSSRRSHAIPAADNRSDSRYCLRSARRVDQGRGVDAEGCQSACGDPRPGFCESRRN